MDWEKFLQFLIEFATSWGLKLLGAIIILIVGLKLVKWVSKWVRTSKKLDKVDNSLRSFLSSFLKIVLYALLLITVASIIGIPATSFLTILASCGVAIGLALQGSLSNFAGGLMILFFKPFKVGDYIEAAGESGTVRDISVVYTLLVTPDNKHITIPNGTLTNSVLKNYSAEKNRRVDFTFDVAYGTDSDKVIKIITDVINAHPLAFKEPAPFVRLSSCADSSLKFTARVWCKSEDYWTVNFDVLESVKNAFEENDIQIPFPQLDVHIDK